MIDIDFQHALMCLNILEKCATVGPMMTSLSGEAGEELKAINEECRQNREERAAKIREEEQVAQQQRLSAAEEANAQPTPEPPVVEPVPNQPATPPVDRKI